MQDFNLNHGISKMSTKTDEFMLCPTTAIVHCPLYSEAPIRVMQEGPVGPVLLKHLTDCGLSGDRIATEP